MKLLDSETEIKFKELTSSVCVPTLCKCTAFELNHSAGGNCPEYVCKFFCFVLPLRRNSLDSNEALFSMYEKKNETNKN